MPKSNVVALNSETLTDREMGNLHAVVMEIGSAVAMARESLGLADGPDEYVDRAIGVLAMVGRELEHVENMLDSVTLRKERQAAEVMHG